MPVTGTLGTPGFWMLGTPGFGTLGTPGTGTLGTLQMSGFGTLGNNCHQHRALHAHIIIYSIKMFSTSEVGKEQNEQRYEQRYDKRSHKQASKLLGIVKNRLDLLYPTNLAP
jgi:hypothetical protein